MPRLRVLLSSLLASLLVVAGGSGSLAAAATTTSTSSLVSLDSSQKLHPLLQYGAAVDPLSRVRVIVQKTGTSVSTASLLALIPGATLVEEFSVIPAFVLTLPQSALAVLAASPNVRYISPDGLVQVLPGMTSSGATSTAKPPAPNSVAPPRTTYDASHLLTMFPIDTGASGAWTGTYGAGTQTGTAINVALIDSGVDMTHPDLARQVIAINVNKNTASTGDGYGHGSHVAGIINGHSPMGDYIGIAPNSTLISVKVSDDAGVAYESDLLRGLNWISANRAAYKIRALNLSVSTSVPQSYATSAIDAAVERLWNDKVTVVAAAGNLGNAQDAVWYAPGNDPRIITVGCLDDNLTTGFGDDSLCPISSRGTTEDGFAKPDLVAPGRKIVSALATSPSGQAVVLAAEFPDHIEADGQHIRLSGTSMAAPQVTGAVALLLQRHGGLTPDQLKSILVGSARAYPGELDRAGMLNIGAALLASDKPPTSTPQILSPVSGTAAPSGTSTVHWDGSRWTSAYWDGSRWTSAYWDGSRWTGAQEWDGSRWTTAYWDGSRWTSAYWDGSRWTSAYWDGSRWTSAAWDSAASLD